MWRRLIPVSHNYCKIYTSFALMNKRSRETERRHANKVDELGFTWALWSEITRLSEHDFTWVLRQEITRFRFSQKVWIELPLSWHLKQEGRLCHADLQPAGMLDKIPSIVFLVCLLVSCRLGRQPLLRSPLSRTQSCFAEISENINSTIDGSAVEKWTNRYRAHSEAQILRHADLPPVPIAVCRVYI